MLLLPMFSVGLVKTAVPSAALVTAAVVPMPLTPVIKLIV